MKKIRAPISVHYELTERCDNFCTHCYNSFRYNPKDLPKGEEYSRKRKAIAKAIVEGDIFHVILTGGEPLLVKDDLFDVAEYLINNRIIVNLNSNLTHLNIEDAKVIKQIDFTSVLTSVIHYDPEIHDKQTQKEGSHKETLRGIEYLVEENIRVGVNMVVTKATVNDVYATGKMLAKIGVQSFSATRVAPNYSPQKYIDQLLNVEEVAKIFDQLLQLKEEYDLRIASLNPIPPCFSKNKPEYTHLLKRGCAAGATTGTIDMDGNLRACQHSCVAEGNILTEGVEAVWDRMAIWKKEYLPKMCLPCPEKMSCGGGCRETARAITDDLTSPDPLARGAKYVLKPEHEMEMEEDKVLRFYNDVKIRSEEKGGILFRHPHSFVVLPEQGYNLALALSGKSFSVAEISDALKRDKNEILPFLNTLYFHAIVKEVEND